MYKQTRKMNTAPSMYPRCNPQRPLVPSEPHQDRERITIRLDADVLLYFRLLAAANGCKDYQVLINSALREYIFASNIPREVLIQRILSAAFARLKAPQSKVRLDDLDEPGGGSSPGQPHDIPPSPGDSHDALEP
jgi:uncharacterized protein (DUF4415 family)